MSAGVGRARQWLLHVFCLAPAYFPKLRQDLHRPLQVRHQALHIALKEEVRVPQSRSKDPETCFRIISATIADTAQGKWAARFGRVCVAAVVDHTES